MATKKKDDDEPIDAEVMGESMDLVSKLPPDMVLMKLENENIMAMAASRPRNHKAILKDLTEQLEAYPSFAAEAIYCKPVGRDDNNVMKYAEGLSIRAAESIRGAFGFNRVSAAAEPLDNDSEKYRITASFTDYQNGMVWTDSVIVTPWYKGRNGKMTRMPDDRFFSLYIPARKSILIREVILRSIPAGLKSELFERANRAMDQGLTADVVKKITAEFGKLNVTTEMLEHLLGDKTTANWSKADQKTIVGLWQAIKDGETTVNEAFGLGDSKPAERKETTVGTVTPEGGITVADLANAKATIEPEKEAKPVVTEATVKAAAEHVGKAMDTPDAAGKVAALWEIFEGLSWKALGTRAGVSTYGIKAVAPLKPILENLSIGVNGGMFYFEDLEESQVDALYAAVVLKFGGK